MKLGFKVYSYKHSPNKFWFVTINGRQFGDICFSESEVRGAIEELGKLPDRELNKILLKAVRARFQRQTPGEYYGAMMLFSILEPLIEEANPDTVQLILDLIEQSPSRGYEIFGLPAPKLSEADPK